MVDNLKQNKNMLMIDDYDVSSLYVRRVPFSVGSDGAAMLCFESYTKFIKHATLPVPDWEDCEVVHDRRDTKDPRMLVTGVYEDIDSTEPDYLELHPCLLVLLDQHMPFVLHNDMCLISGSFLVGKVLKMLNAFDTMKEVRVERSDYDTEQYDQTVHYYLKNGAELYREKGFIENACRYTEALKPIKNRMKDAGLTLTLSQRVALVGVGMRSNEDPIITGYSDGALMLTMHGMTIGIEPDGYTHS